ncbi:hypothetical protein BJ742DRAFT_766624 [Cladochytrium replicatum]|nr:hypothetical protein BJ742DRAFT_766624 [Cladochytrium replicatum]
MARGVMQGVKGVVGVAKGGCLPGVNFMWIILLVVRLLSILIMLMVVVGCVLYEVRVATNLHSAANFFQFLNRLFIFIFALIAIAADLPNKWMGWLIRRVAPALGIDHGYAYLGLLQFVLGSLIVGHEYSSVFPSVPLNPAGNSTITPGTSRNATNTRNTTSTTGATTLSGADSQIITFIIATGFMALIIGFAHMLLGIGGKSLKENRLRPVERGMILESIAPSAPKDNGERSAGGVLAAAVGQVRQGNIVSGFLSGIRGGQKDDRPRGQDSNSYLLPEVRLPERFIPSPMPQHTPDRTPRGYQQSPPDRLSTPYDPPRESLYDSDRSDAGSTRSARSHVIQHQQKRREQMKQLEQGGLDARFQGRRYEQPQLSSSPDRRYDLERTQEPPPLAGRAQRALPQPPPSAGRGYGGYDESDTLVNEPTRPRAQKISMNRNKNGGPQFNR